MKNQIISEIVRQMVPFLDNAQTERLQEVLQHCFFNVDVVPNSDEMQPTEKESNDEFLSMFISSKRVEGCSEKT